MTNTYYAKGKLVFALTKEGLSCFEQAKPESISENEWQNFIKEKYCVNIYDLMDVKSFLEGVNGGLFTDYDGCISEIIVDEYVTNLGLVEGDICQGDFIVSGSILEELSEDHKIEINWANK